MVFDPSAPYAAASSTPSGFDPNAPYEAAPVAGTAPAAKPAEPGMLDTAEQYWEGQKGVYGALGRLGTAVPSMARSAYRAVVNPPTEQEKQDVPYATAAEESPDLTQKGLGRAFIAGKRLLYDPSKAAAEQLDERALREAAQGRPQGMASHVFEHAAASVPVVGPMAVNMAERASDKGDVSGALTEGLGYAMAPKFAEEAAPVVGETMGDLGKATVRGTAKTINAAKNAAPILGPIAGAAEGLARTLKGGSPLDVGFGAATGGYLGRQIGRIPDIPEKFTQFGLPKPEANLETLQKGLVPLKDKLTKAQDAYDTYEASRNAGEPTPSKVMDDLEKAKQAYMAHKAHVDLAQKAIGQPEETGPASPLKHDMTADEIADNMPKPAPKTAMAPKVASAPEAVKAPETAYTLPETAKAPPTAYVKPEPKPAQAPVQETPKPAETEAELNARLNEAMKAAVKKPAEGGAPTEDSILYQRAKAEKPNGTEGEWAQRAQEMKNEGPKYRRPAPFENERNLETIKNDPELNRRSTDQSRRSTDTGYVKPEPFSKTEGANETLKRDPALAEFYRREGDVKPESATETLKRPEETVAHIKAGKPHAIITAENPNSTALSPEENAVRNVDLEKDLRDLGYNPIPATEHFAGNAEHPFIVPDMTMADAEALGKKYGQSSVITEKGYHDLNTGEVIPMQHSKMITGDEAKTQEAYTTVGDQHFSVPMGEAPAEVAKPVTEVAGVKPEAAKAEPTEAKASPEDINTVKGIVSALTDQNVIAAGQEHGIDHSKGYDFSKRSEPSATSSGRHRVDRERFTQDVTAKIPDDMVLKLVKAAEEYDDKDSKMFTNAERNGASRAQRAKMIWDKAHEKE